MGNIAMGGGGGGTGVGHVGDKLLNVVDGRLARRKETQKNLVAKHLPHLHYKC